MGQSASMSHIPFRDSKLTRLLSESLSGNCKTTICACINPSLMHYEETYSTLLFATRAMSVRTNALINERIELRYKEQKLQLKQQSNLQMLLAAQVQSLAQNQ